IAERQEDETRFRLLETIHDFAREKLEASGEAVELRNRHLAYFAKFAETMEANVDGVDQIKWTQISDRERNNLRVALEWGLRADAMFLDGLKVAAATSVYWLARSYYREGVERVHEYLSRATEPEHQPYRVKLLYRGGAMAGYLFDFILGKRFCEQ